MCSHNGREPGSKGLVHVSKDVSRACNGSVTRHTITSTKGVSVFIPLKLVKLIRSANFHKIFAGATRISFKFIVINTEII